MSTATRVLIVDDSATMRMMVSNALETIKGIDVVGMAANPAEARQMRAELQPDVMTLDIEMPGENGLDYLADLMAHEPMPVVMFSTLTSAGASHSLKALELGAVDCFPKMANSNFNSVIAKVGKRIIASKGKVVKKALGGDADVTNASGQWNGAIVGIGVNTPHVPNLLQAIASQDAACAPAIIVLPLDAGLAAPLIGQLQERTAAKVLPATAGSPLVPGTIYLAAAGAEHLTVSAGPTPALVSVARDPINGARPSISILFASLGRSLGAKACGLLFGDPLGDGQPGLRALVAAGGSGSALSDAGVTEIWSSGGMAPTSKSIAQLWVDLTMSRS